MALNPKAFGIAGGLIWGIAVFSMALLGLTGLATGLINGLGTLYLGYTEGFVGSILGLIYGFIDGFIGCYAFAWLYNRFEKK